MRRAGTAMIVAGWGLGIVLLTLLFGGFLERQRNPNTLRSVEAQSLSERLVLRANRNGQYLAEGYLNGVPVEFLLDTGASSVAVPPKIAELAGIVPENETAVWTAGGMARGWQARISKILLGPLEFVDVEAVIVEGLSGHVLLGMSALRGLDFSQKDGFLELR